jgi:RND superfamily putative drug exporter
VLSPTTVLVEAPGIVGHRAELMRLQRSISRLPGVALIVGPTEQPLPAELGAVYSRSRDAVRFLTVFDADPLGATAIRRLRVLRALPGVRTSIAGDTALAEETVRLARADLGRVAPVTLLIVFAVLVARSSRPCTCSARACSSSPRRSGSRSTSSRISSAKGN